MRYAYLSRLGARGQALMVSYIIIAVFIVISGVLMSKGVSERNLSLRNQFNNEVFYLAEGAGEDAIASFIDAIADYQVVPDVEDFFVTTIYNTRGGASVDSSVVCLEDSERPIQEGETNILVRNYEVISKAEHPVHKNISVTLHQVIARRLIPAFQYTIFYNADLEILPGADMLLSGRVHSNQDIYLDSDGATLTVASDYLRSAGNIYNQRKDDGSELAGEVSILVKDSSPQTYEDMDNLDSDVPTWTVDALNRWQGTVQSADHGVSALAVPSVGSIQPDGYYASNADVVIVNGTLTKGGDVLVEGVDYPAGTISTSTTFYNNREGRDVKMTEIDLGKLANIEGEVNGEGVAFANNLPANGLLYATRDDAGAAYQPGIRLKNASQIEGADGLSVVSDDPVYIQGDFNTDNEISASVICDSLNLLSNNWDDSKDHLGVDLRAAEETSVNCAFIAGIDETAPGNYNGGLENYPRLHESWSNIDLNIKGCFLALWNSIIATGEWVYGNPQYKAPNRNWEYNSAFNDTANLPPFTPWAVEAQRVAWWQE